MLKRLDGLVLFLALLLANLRATMFVYLYPDTSVLLGPAWIEIALFFVAFIAAVFVLNFERIKSKNMFLAGGKIGCWYYLFFWFFFRSSGQSVR